MPIQNKVEIACSRNLSPFLGKTFTLPWRVAVVRQCDVSRAQLVDGPEGGDAAVDPVAALDPDQARDQLLLQRVLDACTFPWTSNSQMRDSRNLSFNLEG